jgi:hypothetical protein
MGCAAYIMVAVLDAATGVVIPGFERENCILKNASGTRLPLSWLTNQTAMADGSSSSSLSSSSPHVSVTLCHSLIQSFIHGSLCLLEH